MISERTVAFVLSCAMIGIANAQTESGAQTEPVQSGSAQSEPVQSGSSQSGSTASGSTDSEKEQARSQQEAQKGYDNARREEQAEKMRDKSHDNRAKLDNKSSLGVDMQPAPSVNYKRNY